MARAFGAVFYCSLPSARLFIYAQIGGFHIGMFQLHTSLNILQIQRVLHKTSVFNVVAHISSPVFLFPNMISLIAHSMFFLGCVLQMNIYLFKF